MGYIGLIVLAVGVKELDLLTLLYIHCIIYDPTAHRHYDRSWWLNKVLQRFYLSERNDRGAL